MIGANSLRVEGLHNISLYKEKHKTPFETSTNNNDGCIVNEIWKWSCVIPKNCFSLEFSKFVKLTASLLETVMLCCCYPHYNV